MTETEHKTDSDALPKAIHPHDIPTGGPDGVPGWVHQRLFNPHVLSPGWLPCGQFAELVDALREEHHRQLRQVSVAFAERAAVARRFREADKAHEDATLAAYRMGTTPPADERPSAAEREAEFAPHRVRVVAALTALAEFVQRVVDEGFRANEERFLGSLRARLPGIEEKKRQAQQLLAEARAEQFAVHRVGQWLKSNADDFTQQPALDPTTPAPATWNPSAMPLERPWHQHKPWNIESEKEFQASDHAPAPPPPRPDPLTLAPPPELAGVQGRTGIPEIDEFSEELDSPASMGLRRERRGGDRPPRPSRGATAQVGRSPSRRSKRNALFGPMSH